MKSRPRKRSLPLHRATTVDELTRRNVETIAMMERSSLESRSLGERVADAVASVVGSWPFIIAQSAILSVWLVLNVVGWWKHWDPYPFILLNLALSFQAAYASPIIMMSQNRAARLSERRNHLDLQINLLAEQESTEILRLLRRLCEHHNICSENDDSLKALLQKTKPQHVVEQIEETVEQVDRKKVGKEPIRAATSEASPVPHPADGRQLTAKS